MGGAGAPLPLSGPLLPLLLLLLAAGRVRGAAGGLADSVVWAVNAGGDAHVDVNGIHFRKDPLEGRVGRGEGTGRGGGTGAEGPGWGSAARGACPCPVRLRSSAGNGREQGVQQGPPRHAAVPPVGAAPRGAGHTEGTAPLGALPPARGFLAPWSCSCLGAVCWARLGPAQPPRARPVLWSPAHSHSSATWPPALPLQVPPRLFTGSLHTQASL